MSKKATTLNPLQKFKRKHPNFWKKFEIDSAIKPAKKKQFEKYMRAFRGADVTHRARSFFYKNQLLGPTVTDSHEVLGYVRSEAGLTDRLMDCLKCTKRQAESLIDQWVIMDKDDLREEIKAVLGDITITQYAMWSYRNRARRDDPFFGIDVAHLPCRLGLGSFFDSTRHYAFGHLLPPGAKARRPTCFDSDLCDYWIGGGYTKPHSACRRKYPKGLPEVVHHPNTFTAIYTKIIAL